MDIRGIYVICVVVSKFPKTERRTKQTTARRFLATKDIDLDSWLIERRDAGASPETIALDLSHLTGRIIEVSYTTIGYWIRELDGSTSP